MKQRLSWALGLALATLALAGPVRAQAPPSAPQDGFARVAAAVDELSKVWDTWEPIENFKPEAYSQTPDGKPVKIGSAKGVHADTEKYGHVDVARAYAFDSTDLAFAQIESQFFRAIAIREENGKLIVLREAEMTPKLDAKGEVESFTITFTRGDKTKGSRTFTRPAPKTKA